MQPVLMDVVPYGVTRMHLSPQPAYYVVNQQKIPS